MEAYKKLLEEERGPVADEDDEEEDTTTGLPAYTSCRGVKYYGYSCLVLMPRDPIRKFFATILDYGSDSPDVPSYFDCVMMLIIGYSAIHLARFDPYDTTIVPTNGTELFLNIAFSVELLIVTTARGFIVPKHAYLQDLWGWLDLSVVIAGWLPFCYPGCALRQCSALRPRSICHRMPPC